MANANIAINFDFNELLDVHIKNMRDATTTYRVIGEGIYPV